MMVLYRSEHYLDSGVYSDAVLSKTKHLLNYHL